MSDSVNHPGHYTSHPSGIEAIELCEHLGFNCGNAVKYLFRCGLKGSHAEDIRKARWYLQRIAESMHPAVLRSVFADSDVADIVRRVVTAAPPGDVLADVLNLLTKGLMNAAVNRLTAELGPQEAHRG